MTKELSRNIDLTGTSVSDKEKQEKFRACADPVENARQIASIGDMLEQDLYNAYETSKMSVSDALQTNEGKELSAALGPTVMLTERDQFWAEALADRYSANFGDPVYYMTSHDAPLQVVSASMTDGGSGMAVNTLQTMKGYDKPIPVAGQRLVMTFEYDDPRLAESNFSSRAKAINFARYRIRKAQQDMLLSAWVGGFSAALPAAVYHDLPAGRVHPTTNVFDVSVAASGSGKMDYAALNLLSDYFDTFGWSGQKILAVSPKRFNDIKKWMSTTTATDAGTVFAKQLISQGAAIDSMPIFDVLIVKKNNIPDNLGYALVVDDGINKTLGIYQWGKVQTVPSNVQKPLRAAFDVYIPGITAVNHDIVRVAQVKFA